MVVFCVGGSMFFVPVCSGAGAGGVGGAGGAGQAAGGVGGGQGVLPGQFAACID